MFFRIMRYAGLLASVSFFSAALAVESPEENPWDGSDVRLGLVDDTGNSQDLDINTQLNLQYEQAKWSNDFQLATQFSRSDGEVTKEKYFLQNQWNYQFGQNQANYYFFNGNFTEDKFSPYSYQLVVASGYGRRLIKTDKLLWRVQAGPGLRRDKEADSDEISNYPIIATGSTLKWRITDTMTFTEALTYDLGKPYNYLKSVAAVTSKMMTHLSIQMSYTVEHYSKIPAFSTNTEKTDTTTSVALVYTF